MAPETPCNAERTADRPLIEVADIFRAHGDAYRRAHVLSPEQHAAMRAIESCRTPALGGHLDVCNQCGYERPSYNSCRNRCCPKCQSLAQHQWLEKRRHSILPTRYFHVVATVPHELNPLILRNRKLLYGHLFQAAARTLLTLGQDERRLGAQLGITAVLHTWSRDLLFHPHLHAVVTGGGLSSDGTRWLAVEDDFLFPVQVMSRLFRGKFLDAINRCYEARQLDLGGGCSRLEDPNAFQRLKDKLYAHEWVVYAKRPFGGPEQVYKYLSMYTHRIALSNYRLLSFDARGVRFSTKDGGEVTVAPMEFIRRFLLHVLPKGFTKIRHFGLHGPSNTKTRLAAARSVLHPPEGSTIPSQETPTAPATTEPVTEAWQELCVELMGVDLRICPQCRVGTMVRQPLDYVPPPSEKDRPLQWDTS